MHITIGTHFGCTRSINIKGEVMVGGLDGNVTVP